MDPEPMTAAEFDAIYAEAIDLLDLADEQWDREQALLDND
jgi:hypothetical protein